MFEQEAPRSCEAEVLARELLAWSEELASLDGPFTHLLEEERQDLVRGLASGIKSIRRGQQVQFGKLNFGDPALRIMLEIVVHEKRGRRASIDRLASESGTDRVLIVHSVQTLVDLGLVVTAPEKCDGRNLWVQLSQRARVTMFDMLVQAAELLRPRGCGLPL